MNLTFTLRELVDALVEITSEGKRGDIEGVVFSQLDPIIKDYSFLREVPWGDEYYEGDYYEEN
jgi:hypothetical protein